MRTLVMAIATVTLLAASAQSFADDSAKPEDASDTAAPAAAETTSASETLDLTEEKDSFAPYANERHPLWALLPATAIAIVLLHLRKSKPQPRRTS
jgi:hypothetical protein